ncbi:MAG: aminoacyl-tRNA hydrolase [Planctomycetaceae bacterium]
MKVVVGLGNPDPEYHRTRHNIGFAVVDELARRHGALSGASRFEARTVGVFLGGEKLLLVEPQTYMNLSGRCVRKVLDFHQVEPADLLVVCDDMNLETGRVRLKPGGSAGGQKGLADIIQKLGTQEFARMRLGIGRPPGRMSPTDYVLGRFREPEREAAEHVVLRAADGVELWVTEGLDAAMNAVNAPAES